MTNFKLHILIALVICFAFSHIKSNSQNINNKEIGKQFIETLNNHDYQKFISLFDESCYYEEVCSGRKYFGKDNIQMYIRSTIEGMPDTEFKSVTICSDEKRVMIEWIWHGTNSVGWPEMGIHPTNKKMQLEGVSVIETENGKIKNVKDYWDWNSFVKSIGVEN